LVKMVYSINLFVVWYCCGIFVFVFVVAVTDIAREMTKRDCRKK